MSAAAAVIMKRFKQIITYFEKNGALAPDRALPQSEVPFCTRWFFRRLLAVGAIREVGDRVYLDAAAAREFMRGRKRRILWALLLALAAMAAILVLTRA